jgi:hypothetical protein
MEIVSEIEWIEPIIEVCSKNHIPLFIKDNIKTQLMLSKEISKYEEAREVFGILYEALPGNSGEVLI